MSLTIGSALMPFAGIGRLGVDALGLETQSATLTAQGATGLVDPEVAGLGSATAVVLDLQPQFAANNAYAANATAAGARLSVAAAALTSVGSLATSLATSLTSLAGTTGAGLATAIASDATGARAALQSLGSLLNAQSGDDYVFAGTSSGDPPVPDPSALTGGTLFTSIGDAVAGLGAGSAAATMSGILSLAANTGAGQPFASTLSTDPVTAAATAASVPVGAGEFVVASVPATGGFAPTAGSTGSPIRDLVAALSAVANLGAASTDAAGLSTLVGDLQSLASGAANGIADMSASVGVSQTIATRAETVGNDTANALTAQLGGLTSVDLSSVSTRLTTVNDQLQASYELIADLKGLSLADYL